MHLASSELDELPSSTRAPAKKPPRLDDTESIILVAAANRPDRIVLPVRIEAEERKSLVAIEGVELFARRFC